MPILRIESSAHVAVDGRAAVLAAIVATAVEHLEVAPRQVRAMFIDVSSGAWTTGDDGDAPWVVAWCSMLAGRTQERKTAFVTALCDVLARELHVDGGAIRVLIDEYARDHWFMGAAAIAAVGRS